MNLLRRIGLGLAAGLLPLLLISFVLCISIYAVLDRSLPLKQALRDSGVYAVFTESSLEQKQAENPSLPLKNDVVHQALMQAFPSEYIQNTNEQLIDRTYAWIHGTTPSLDLAINLAGPKNVFADHIANYVRQRLAALPVCQQFVTAPTTLDEFLTLTCRPPGVSAETLAETARQKALESKTFDEFAFRPETIENTQSRTLNDQLSFVPAAHRYYIMSLYVIPAVLVLCTIATIFWSITRRAGIKRVAYTLLATGIAAILFGIVVVWGIGQITELLSDKSSLLIALQSKLITAIDILATQLRNWWIGFGIGYVLIGIGLLVGIKIHDHTNRDKVEKLNSALGYREDIPPAGTTFDPKPTSKK